MPWIPVVTYNNLKRPVQPAPNAHGLCDNEYIGTLRDTSSGRNIPKSHQCQGPIKTRARVNVVCRPASTTKNNKQHQQIPWNQVVDVEDQKEAEKKVMLGELQVEVVPTSNPLVVVLVRRAVNHLVLTPVLVKVRGSSLVPTVSSVPHVVKPIRRPLA